MEEVRSAPEAETPFRMLVIGDFCGRANRALDKSANPLTGLKPIWVDRDTIDEVLDRGGKTGMVGRQDWAAVRSGNRFPGSAGAD